MANRLSRAQIEEMWDVYRAHESVREVARTCAVSHVTVERYRERERWDERLAEVRAKAALEADTSLAAEVAASLKVVRAYERKLADAVARKNVCAADATATELREIVKLKLLLLGGAESRTEIRGPRSWTPDQMQAFLDNGTLPG